MYNEAVGDIKEEILHLFKTYLYCTSKKSPIFVI